ncbi:MFS transporter [Prauserella cavernicola]|uniref:MFS transporter n=1 Tax=Prauserella cavernicola TaxID=2800127 RepID=A0A934QPY9_9PSEU|nr:MFS transporter [Prauserella cavernicola]MBK1783918.1 MFS transporter [Prauserella cavernicola]
MTAETEKFTTAPATDRTSALRAFLISGLGTALEYYDFLIYGLAAGLVFNTVFFPASDPLVGTLYSFAAFGTGFLARPLGGIVIGHFGDKVGRKKMLIITLSTMGVSTFLIGLLPDFNTIGIWAPVLLVALRLIQGFAAGGEWGGAALFGIENAPGNRRGLWGSFTSMGIGLGTFLGVAAFALTSVAFDDQLTPWGWRIPFLLGGALVIIAMLARLTMPDDTVAAGEQDGTTRRIPIVEALRRSPRTVLLGLGVSYGYNTFAYIGFTFLLSYLTMLGYGTTESLVSQLVYSVVLFVSAPFWAFVSDKVGRRPVMAIGGVASGAFLFLFFVLANSNSITLVVVGFSLVGLLTGVTQGPIPAFTAEQYPARMRYSGMSASYQIGASIGGGTASFIATALLVATGQNPVSVAIYGTFAMLVLVGCSLALRETAHLSTAEVDDPDGENAALS